MIELTDHRVFLGKNYRVSTEGDEAAGRAKSMAWRILEAHNHSGSMDLLRLRFDAMVSPDNNYVNILQTARASGLKAFPVPYVLSNCHNTLCAVGGTINEDDHVFGRDSVVKYGGVFVPPYRAVLHQYMREMMAGGGRLILGSDSHTRYGALGTMGIGEGGGELVKQLVGRTYDIARPPILAVRLSGRPRPGVGPMDVALALVAACFGRGFTKNKVLEFVGEGIRGLSMEYRMGIDVMTTESGALSSIWETDDRTREYLREHGREGDYVELHPGVGACYDGLIDIDLSAVECMIALPFHPSRAVPIRALKADLPRYLGQVEADARRIQGGVGAPFDLSGHVTNGTLRVDQALVSGCAGGMFENIAAVADILRGHAIPGGGIQLGVNPCSLPVMADLMAQGIAGELALSGVTLRPCICGPCFGVTDSPANGQLSARHVTRNYANREGSRPGQGQMAAVCLMDARSIAATVRNGGLLTAATELEGVEYREWRHRFDGRVYAGQVYDCRGKADPEHPLTMGPNIADWPALPALRRHLLLKVTGCYAGSVTTDELIPSGEASSYRSNPERISGYTLTSKDPGYVPRAKALRALTRRLEAGEAPAELAPLLERVCGRLGCDASDISVGGVMVADEIGDGSSREQAASCQKVLGGWANLAHGYATKRYRSNCVNWGLLPLITPETLDIPEGSWLLLPDVRALLEGGGSDCALRLLDECGATLRELPCSLGALTDGERAILTAGCLINAYRQEPATPMGAK